MRTVPTPSCFHQVPFLEAIFVPEPGGEPLFLHGYNRVIGPARLRQVRTRGTCTAHALPRHCTGITPALHRHGICTARACTNTAPWRQVRVDPGTCTVPAMFASLIDSCYAPYAPQHIATAPFGPEDVPNQWTHRTAAQLDAMGRTLGSNFRGRFANYDGGGYVADLPSNLTAARLAVEQLEQRGFVDRATRAIFVDLAAFNANVGMFYSARIVFEFLPSGGIVSSAVLRVLKPLLYEDTADFVRLVFELLLVLLLAGFLVTEARQINRVYRETGGLGLYFGVWWNVLDWCNALLLVAAVVLRLYLVVHTLEMLELIGEIEPEQYVNLQPLMFQLQQVHNIGSVNCLLLFVKAFQYLALVPQVKQTHAYVRAQARP